jgi:hypothetical protein
MTGGRQGRRRRRTRRRGWLSRRRLSGSSGWTSPGATRTSRRYGGGGSSGTAFAGWTAEVWLTRLLTRQQSRHRRRSSSGSSGRPLLGSRMKAGPGRLCFAKARRHQAAGARPKAGSQRLAWHVVRGTVGDMRGCRTGCELGAGGSGGVLVKRQVGDGPRARVDTNVAPGSEHAVMGGTEAGAVLRASLGVGR